jgi:hypothetical protein
VPFGVGPTADTVAPDIPVPIFRFVTLPLATPLDCAKTEFIDIIGRNKVLTSMMQRSLFFETSLSTLRVHCPPQVF